MALDQYLEETMPQIDSFEDKQSLQKWKSSSDSIADSDRNASCAFDCNICLECVQDPVVTLCGHLYCWPCIYKWLHHQSISWETEVQQKPKCPVCKSEVSQSSLVPLYGRGQTTTPPSKGKVHQVGIVIPRRPLGPISYNTTVSQPISQSYHHAHHSYHPQQFNSIPSSYTSPMLSTSGSLDNTFGIFGEMIFARVFGNRVANIYTYPNSYNLSGNSNPRIRRHLMQVDKSLSRISFFLLCCLVLCLLLF
ncbi:E3 ubiquitin-protein ligase RMA1H1-like [Gastrolobium bilobum]|uniref:E3 ubiquitin-protein ligase RMA1H1-like n=1 Tax=Gastrolobium bilobum TaxID=150636 RepID=UPI002AAFD43C|nr:E3 ubiquitin-protein ligase RMA1H1-like [Gastrolobium bilobum]